MYILHCCDGSYYTGSTKDLELRLEQHMEGKGANHTRKRLPVKLLYFEEYQRIDDAYYREKQVQGWNRKKKEALIDGKPELLPEMAIAYRDRNISETQSRPEAPQSRPEALEGQLYEDDISSESATPFGFECLSQRGSLSQRGAPHTSLNEPESRPKAPKSRPRVSPERSLRSPLSPVEGLSKASRTELQGQPHEDENSPVPESPFGFENLSRRGSLNTGSNEPQSRPEGLEGQPHEVQASKGQPKSKRNLNQ